MRWRANGRVRGRCMAGNLKGCVPLVDNSISPESKLKNTLIGLLFIHDLQEIPILNQILYLKKATNYEKFH